MLPQLSKRFNQLGQPLLEASWSSSMPVASNNVSVNKEAAIKMRPPVSSPLIEPYLNPMQGPVLIESTEVSDDIVFAWNMLQNSPVVGSRPQFSVASTNYDSNGNAIGLVPRRDAGKGLWMGGQVANLFAGGSSQARSVTLTAQPYTLFVWSGSASCSYGAATPGNPLKFTATAGDTVFTPTGVSKWMLVAGTFGDMPYVPPGATQLANAATTGNNGTNIPLDAGLLECFRGKTDGVELVSSITPTITQGASSANTWDRDTKTVRIKSDGGESSYIYWPIPNGSTNRYLLVVSELSGTGLIKEIASSTVLQNGSYELTGYSGFGISRLSVCDITCTISIQRLLPAVCTVMAEHYMGVGSGDLFGSSSPQILLCPNTNSTYPIYFRGDAIDQANSKVISGTDGTSWAEISQTWSANEIHRRYVQTSSDGTKFRVGYQRYTSAMVEITSGIQWSHTGVESTWAAFDGSFNPLTYLRLGLNLSAPIWGRKLLISDKTLTDAEIKNAWEVVK